MEKVSEEYTGPCRSMELIMDLAAGYSGAGKEVGFKMAFHIATRLFAEGMKGTGC